MAKIAFTGTTDGLTEHQRWNLGNFFHAMQGKNELHHGMAVGADAEAHAMATEVFGWDAVGYPGVNKRGEPAGRAVLTGFSEVRPERPYLLRNRDIVAVPRCWLRRPRGRSGSVARAPGLRCATPGPQACRCCCCGPMGEWRRRRDEGGCVLRSADERLRR